MTLNQKKKILTRIVALESDIEKLKQVRIELGTSGYASASFSAGGGSKSYTRLDIGKVTETIQELTSEVKGLRAKLNATSKAMPNVIYPIYF